MLFRSYTSKKNAENYIYFKDMQLQNIFSILVTLDESKKETLIEVKFLQPLNILSMYSIFFTLKKLDKSIDFK